MWDFLQEVFRVLSPGGLYAMVTPKKQPQYLHCVDWENDSRLRLAVIRCLISFDGRFWWKALFLGNFVSFMCKSSLSMPFVFSVLLEMGTFEKRKENTRYSQRRVQPRFEISRDEFPSLAFDACRLNVPKMNPKVNSTLLPQPEGILPRCSIMSSVCHTMQLVHSNIFRIFSKNVKRCGKRDFAASCSLLLLFIDRNLVSFQRSSGLT